MSVRRDALKDISFQPQSFPNAGLWFDKYLKKQKDSTLEPYAKHIELTGKIHTRKYKPQAYAAFFKRWKAQLKAMGAELREAEVVGRLAAGLGGESVIENGLTFHHTYGVPIIPGSSLKGTARTYAAANLDGVWAEKGAAFRTLFGGQVLAPDDDDSDADKERKKARIGIAIFYDALPLPGTFKIHNEVMTVHHKEHYGDGSQPPADWDSPTPIPFASASGTFLIAIHTAPEWKEWAGSAMGILKMALAESGVGGKTSSGYGRFTLTELTLSPEEQNRKNFYEALNALPNNRVANQIHRFVNRWRSPEIPKPYKQEVAQAILNKVHEAGRKKNSQDKSWYQSLEDCVHNENCPD